MLNALASISENLFYEDLLECIEYGNQGRVTKLLSISEVVERALIPNSDGKLDVLKSAAKGGNLAIFEQLIQNPAILAKVAHYSTSYDTGLLGIAVENRHIDLVRKLLTIPDVVDKAENLPYVLGTAAHLGNLAIVEELLTDPKVANCAYAALHAALDEGEEADRIACIKLLLAVPTVIENIVAGQCSMIVHGFLCPETAQVLLDIPTIAQAIHREPSAMLRNAFTSEIAAVLSIPSIQSRLGQCQAEAGFDLAFYKQMISEFLTDLELKDIELVKKMLSIKPIDDYFALRLKAEDQKILAFAGRLDLLENFIENRQGDPEVDEELFSWACEGGNIDTVLYLLGFSQIREIVLSDTQGHCNFLRDTATTGNVKILNLLLAFISYDTTIQSLQALAVASEYGHRDMVKCLLQLPHVHCNISQWKTAAIVQAAKHGHIDVLTLLLATPHNLAGTLSTVHITEILTSHSTNMMIIDTFLTLPFVARSLYLAIEALGVAERDNLSLMKRLLHSPGAIIGLNSNPALLIKVLKATLKSIMRSEGQLQAVESDTNNIKKDIIAVLDNIVCSNQIPIKSYLTKMQRNAYDAYCPVKQSLLDSSLELQAEGSQELDVSLHAGTSSPLTFSTRKRNDREGTSLAPVIPTPKADDSVKRLRQN